MLYPDHDASRRFAGEYQALLAQDARRIRRERLEARPVARRRGTALLRRLRIA